MSSRPIDYNYALCISWIMDTCIYTTSELDRLCLCCVDYNLYKANKKGREGNIMIDRLCECSPSCGAGGNISADDILAFVRGTLSFQLLLVASIQSLVFFTPRCRLIASSP